jgi:hypothetical protein
MQKVRLSVGIKIGFSRKVFGIFRFLNILLKNKQKTTFLVPIGLKTDQNRENRPQSGKPKPTIWKTTHRSSVGFQDRENRSGSVSVSVSRWALNATKLYEHK